MNESSQTPTSGPVYHHGDLHNALLEAVAELVEESGSAAVSLREVARRAGVSHSAPAHHFGDKEGMLAAFSTKGFIILGEAMLEARSSAAHSNALERMGAVGASYVTFALEHRPYFEVMFKSDVHKDIFEELHTEADRTFAVLMEAVGDLAAEKGLQAVDQRIVAMYFWSLAHGLASIASDGSMPPELEELSISEYIAGVFSMSETILEATELQSRAGGVDT